MNIAHVPKTKISPDTPSFGLEFEFLIAVLANPSIENPNPSDPRTVYFPSTPEDGAPSYFQIPAGKEDWANEWSIYAHIKRSLSSIGLPTELGKATSNFAMWEVTSDGSIKHPNPPHRRNKKAYTDWKTYTYYPIEIRTPAYYYSEDALKDITDFCKIMRKTYLITINESCGLHVHIGYGTHGFTLPHLRRLGAIIQAFEPQFDSIHPEHRIDSRNVHCVSFRRNTYFQCKYRQDRHRSPRVLETIAMLLACESRDVFRTCVASEGAAGAHSHGGGSTAWNFDRMGTEMRGGAEGRPDTVGFRGHEGSLDAEVVGNWVRVLVGVVEYARSVEAWGFGELLSRVRGEKWERGEMDQRVTGRGRHEPGGVMYRPVFGEEWCGLVDLLRILKLDGPAEYYENREGKWLENRVYKHWYTHAPSEYVVNPVYEDCDDANDDDDDNREYGKLSAPSTSSSGSKSGRFDPFDPNPITPVKLVNKTEGGKPEGKKTTPGDLKEYKIKTRFSDPPSSSLKDISNPKAAPIPGTRPQVPSFPTTNSSTQLVPLTLSHYEREAIKSRAVTTEFLAEEQNRAGKEAEKETGNTARAVWEKTESNRKKSSTDLGSERAISERSEGSRSPVEFINLGAEDEEVWAPLGWRGVEREEISEETKVFDEEKKLAEEQKVLEEIFRNLKPGIDYLHPVRHLPLRTLPGPTEYTQRTQNQHSHLLQDTPRTEIEALAPNTANFPGRLFHRAFRAPSTPWLSLAPSGTNMNPHRNPYPGPTPLIQEHHTTLLQDALGSPIGEEWTWDHELRSRSTGIQRMLRGHQLHEVSPIVKTRLLAYNYLLRHHTRGRELHRLFPARAHNVAHFEAAEDRWWRAQIAEGEIVRLQRQAANSDEEIALAALEALDSLWIGDRYCYSPEGVQNPFVSGPRTQARIEEDVSPGADISVWVSGPDTPVSAVVEEGNKVGAVREEAEEAAAEAGLECFDVEKTRMMEIAMVQILKARAEAVQETEGQKNENGEGKDITRAGLLQNSWEQGDEGEFVTV